ncbi:hypothetical protein BJY21_001831 [Kineosphaera limosa]|uniref:YdbS-like PH domain-containing protein n=1 Tax=Kineosphaera limosa NBRC 100340 TaxID=1184609 RepID=K6WU82_9MICO|nr:PH domain-containing protein [Kineosphaera limosa]NYE00647.1 hypothetical protein [Kineosphaera limosa]GAB97381.1 hypothetical protein KILIM_066_00220 [Kineosphaera limosa NBRC 100340]
MGTELTDLPPEARPRRPAHLVSRRARVVWRVAALLTWIWPIGGVVGWMWFDDGNRSWQWLALGVVLVLAAVYLVVVPEWRFRVHRWEVTDDAVYTQSGWISQERRVAPISRIQTVDSEFGPIERLFGLGTLTVTTASAAGALRVAGLERATVDELVEELTRITSQVRGDAT